MLQILVGIAFHATGPETENARFPSFVRVLGRTLCWAHGRSETMTIGRRGDMLLMWLGNADE